jgi:hypothetical protein
MPKISNAFAWSVVGLVSAMFGWLFYCTIYFSNGFSDAVPAVTVPRKPMMTKETVAVRLPVKPSEQGSSDEMRNCKLTRYEGKATVKGWYEQEEVSGKKSLVLKVADEDRPKLPEKIQTWADGTPIESIILSNVSAQMKKLLIKASAEEPVNVDLVAVDVPCEGFPTATLAEK